MSTKQVPEYLVTNGIPIAQDKTTMVLLTDTKVRHIKPDDKPLPHDVITVLTLLTSSNNKQLIKLLLGAVSPEMYQRQLGSTQ